MSEKVRGHHSYRYCEFWLGIESDPKTNPKDKWKFCEKGLIPNRFLASAVEKYVRKFISRIKQDVDQDYIRDILGDSTDHEARFIESFRRWINVFHFSILTQSSSDEFQLSPARNRLS